MIFPPEKETTEGGVSQGEVSELLEKPTSKDEQMRALLLMAGRSCEVVTGVTIGKSYLHVRIGPDGVSLVYPSIEAPGYKLE